MLEKEKENRRLRECAEADVHGLDRNLVSSERQASSALISRGVSYIYPRADCDALAKAKCWLIFPR